MTIAGVLFDWRGTLAVHRDGREWVGLALEQCGSNASADTVLKSLEGAQPERLWAPGVDTSAAVHRAAHEAVFADAGLEPSLAAALYDIESDVMLNPLVEDAVETMQGLSERGLHRFGLACRSRTRRSSHWPVSDSACPRRRC